ncbi:MAG: phage tail protein [Myxococcales bacterium]|nr:phage tail protein [Myxococcales bacterium]
MPTRRRIAFHEMIDDHIGNYNFRVIIGQRDFGQFAGVDGLSIENEVIEYQDGNDFLVRKRPGRVKYGDITLKKGYVNNTILFDWIDASRLGNGDYGREEISIVLHANDDPTKDPEIKRWNCFECFPKSWKVSSMDGKGNDVLVEELVFTMEWFEEA